MPLLLACAVYKDSGLGKRIATGQVQRVAGEARCVIPEAERGRLAHHGHVLICTDRHGQPSCYRALLLWRPRGL